MRRCLRISRRERTRNEMVKQRMGVEGSMIQSASRLSKQILEWQPMGRRKRARPKIEWQKTIHKPWVKKNWKKRKNSGRLGRSKEVERRGGLEPAYICIISSPNFATKWKEIPARTHSKVTLYEKKEKYFFQDEKNKLFLNLGIPVKVE